MCGRFTLTAHSQTIANTFNVAPTLQMGPRYNIAPTQEIVTIVGNGSPHLELQQWGLVPSWSKDERSGAKMINARAETLAEKPSFKRLLHARRCLVVADGFYEWQQRDGGKTPMYITLKDGVPFAFAGLWDTWKRPDGQLLRTCTIITTEPNELVSSIHNRMPVILGKEARERWLDPELQDEHALLPLLAPFPATEMTARPVSRLLNNPRYDSAELLA